MTPRWGLEGPEGRRLPTKMAHSHKDGSFASSCTGLHSGNNPQICRTPCRLEWTTEVKPSCYTFSAW